MYETTLKEDKFMMRTSISKKAVDLGFPVDKNERPNLFYSIDSLSLKYDERIQELVNKIEVMKKSKDSYIKECVNVKKKLLEQYADNVLNYKSNDFDTDKWRNTKLLKIRKEYNDLITEYNLEPKKNMLPEGWDENIDSIKLDPTPLADLKLFED